MKHTIDLLSIEPLTEVDLSAASAVFAASWKFAYHGIIADDYLDALTSDQWVEPLADCLTERSADQSTTPPAEHLAEHSGSPKRRVLLLKSNTKIIGVSWFGPSTTADFPHDGEITAFYLLPDYLGHNLGAPLMQRTLQELAKMNYQNFVLDVFKGNERAQRFYTRHGFTVVTDNLAINLGGSDYPCFIMRRPALLPEALLTKNGKALLTIGETLQGLYRNEQNAERRLHNICLITTPAKD